MTSSTVSLAGEFSLAGEKVLLPEGLGPATVIVAEGRIAEIRPGIDLAAPSPIEVGSAVLMAGLVDPHVHINEPGRTDWEGFATATRAAAAGGITTLVDMPLNSSPVTTTALALAAKERAAAGQCQVDVGFWGGVVAGNQEHLSSLLEAGVLGLKAFLPPSGLDEFPAAGADDLRAALTLGRAAGTPLLVHAESPQVLARAEAAIAGRDPRRYATYLASRPAAAEVEAIQLLQNLCHETGGWVHVVHVAAAEALELLAAARSAGLNMTAETCPHYLTFTAQEVPEGETLFKCAPPLREGPHREALWEGLRSGCLDLVATDHSPCPPALKLPEEGNFLRAWGGIASLQLLLPAVWTEARARGFSVADLGRWLCHAPARLAGLAHRKGTLRVGHDADLVIWDSEAPFTVRGRDLQHRHPGTPYEGRRLWGRVLQTYVRGIRVYDRGRFPATPRGEILRRPVAGSL